MRVWTIVLITTSAILTLSTASSPGGNSNAKVAIHIKVHAAKQTCGTLPAISDSYDIVTTCAGSNFDFFPVFFNLTEYLGVEYGMTWPDWTYTCAFTSCSDLVIGEIESPGDGIAHTWTACKTEAVAIPGWGWLYADSAGMVCIIDHPDAKAVHVLDCDEGLDEPIANFCAGVYGATGDDPTVGGRGGAPEGAGESGGIRGYYRP
jgi:hypothetical protein